jgi:ABC-type cobalamin transport system permease subunit
VIRVRDSGRRGSVGGGGLAIWEVQSKRGEFKKWRIRMIRYISVVGIVGASLSVSDTVSDNHKRAVTL